MQLLIASGDNPWVGLAFIGVVIVVGAVAHWSGLRVGRSRSVPERVHQDSVNAGRIALMRKMRYKNLSEDWETQVGLVEAHVETIRAARPHPDLDKIARSFRSFDRLRNRNDELHRKTIDLDLSEFQDDEPAKDDC